MYLAAIEGIDRVGKTTLIDLLRATRAGVQVRRLERAWTGTVDAKLDWLDREVSTWDQSSQVVVYDRLVIPSEYVYGESVRLETALSRAHEMAVLGLKYVYLDPGEYSLYHDRVQHEPDEVFQTHHQDVFEKLVQRYRTFIHKVEAPVLALKPGRLPDLNDADQVWDFILGKVRIYL